MCTLRCWKRSVCREIGSSTLSSNSPTKVYVAIWEMRRVFDSVIGPDDFHSLSRPADELASPSSRLAGWRNLRRLYERLYHERIVRLGREENTSMEHDERSRRAATHWAAWTRKTGLSGEKRRRDATSWSALRGRAPPPAASRRLLGLGYYVFDE